MKWPKKIIYILSGLILVVVLLNFGLNFWITNKLPEIINDINDSPYKITYKDIDVSLISRNIKAYGIVVVPKASVAADKNKQGLYGSVESIDVAGISLIDLIFSDRIKAQTLVVRNPEVTFIKPPSEKGKKRKTLRDEFVAPFSKIIYVSDIFIEEGNIRMFSVDRTPLLEAKNLSLNIEDIVITDATLEGKLPFAFGRYAWKCDSLIYRANADYRITALKIRNTEHDLEIDKFLLAPVYARDAFVAKLPTEKDQYAVKAQKIRIDSLQWGFKNERLFIDAKTLHLDNVTANIFRSKVPPDDMKEKKLYSRLLRDLSYDIDIRTLKMRNSKITYEEQKDRESSPGKLYFSNFYMTASNISTATGKAKLPDVTIDVKCRFMGSADMNVEWRFNVLDKSDSFNIRGSVIDFPAERLMPFSKPYMNATFKGDLDEVYFNFSGNRQTMTGDFAINYDDLKVSVYRKKDKKKKNKLLSALANLFVKNDTKDKVTTAEIKVERIEEKSFFNFLWRSVQEGLKEILL